MGTSLRNENTPHPQPMKHGYSILAKIPSTFRLRVRLSTYPLFIFFLEKNCARLGCCSGMAGCSSDMRLNGTMSFWPSFLFFFSLPFLSRFPPNQNPPPFFFFCACTLPSFSPSPTSHHHSTAPPVVLFTSQWRRRSSRHSGGGSEENLATSYNSGAKDNTAAASVNMQLPFAVSDRGDGPTGGFPPLLLFGESEVDIFIFYLSLVFDC